MALDGEPFANLKWNKKYYIYALKTPEHLIENLQNSISLIVYQCEIFVERTLASKFCCYTFAVIAGEADGNSAYGAVAEANRHTIIGVFK